MFCIGKIVKPHGIKGAVKFKSYLEDAKIIDDLKFVFFDKQQISAIMDCLDRDALYTNAKNVDCKFDQDRYLPIMIESSSCKMEKLNIIKFKDINSCDMAESMRLVNLYTTDLPKIIDDDTFYYHELKGLKVILTNNLDYGTVKQVYDYNGNSVMEIIKDKEDGALDNQMFLDKNKVDKINLNKSSSNTVLISFSKTNVPAVNIEDGYVMVNHEIIKEMELING